jgi:hypothetical protein
VAILGQPCRSPIRDCMLHHRHASHIGATDARAGSRWRDYCRRSVTTDGLRRRISVSREGHFDFHIRIWQTHLWCLERPLTGSRKWVEYDGTTIVRKVWNGRANLLELDVTGPTGRIEALALLLLYNPEAPEIHFRFVSY